MTSIVTVCVCSCVEFAVCIGYYCYSDEGFISNVPHKPSSFAPLLVFFFLACLCFPQLCIFLGKRFNFVLLDFVFFDYLKTHFMFLTVSMFFLP